MPEYKRLVSYMYNYEDGIKKHNVGYARVEARNGQCKCTIHIATPSLNDKQLKVHIFKRNKDGLEGVLLGMLQVRSGSGDYRTVTDSLHIMNSPYSLDDMGGIVLYLTERKFLATSWDETPITMDMVAGMEGIKQERELKAADVTADKINPAKETPENNTETVKEDSGRKEAAKETDKYGQQRKQQDIESKEYRNEIEGEVFNDLDTSNEFKNEKSSDTQEEAELNKVTAEETGKEESRKESPKEDKDIIREEDKEEKDKLTEELNSPVEILQKENLSKAEAAKDKERDNSDEVKNISKTDGKNDTAGPTDTDSGTAILKNAETAAETEKNSAPESENTIEPVSLKAGEPAGKDTPEASESTLKYITPESSDNIGVLNAEKENLNLQSEVKSEDIQKNSEKQPFFEEPPLAKRIYNSFPRMHPFEDNEVAWCVRIEPQDIGLFPMEAWILGNNSFLLHGYYSYRHLIFGRMNDKNGFSYILGVPGIYHNREKFMARMFGFENFKCAKRKAQRTGEFGYWYIPITLT